MKAYLIAAGALLIGTSAFAYDAVEADKLATFAATQQLKAAVLDVVAEAAVAETARALAASAEKDGVMAGGDPDLDLAVRPDGMGGPLEAVPATQSYPPCRPGPGDDHCIQLYEPGVRARLASWTGTVSGVGNIQPAMGGPYEPVDGGGTGDTAMNGDGSLDVAMGEAPADEGLVSADAAASAYTGMGGPIAETGYPPCRPGPGDDHCIQLYERGVTGSGN